MWIHKPWVLLCSILCYAASEPAEASCSEWFRCGNRTRSRCLRAFFSNVSWLKLSVFSENFPCEELLPIRLDPQFTWGHLALYGQSVRGLKFQLWMSRQVIVSLQPTCHSTVPCLISQNLDPLITKFSPSPVWGLILQDFLTYSTYNMVDQHVVFGGTRWGGSFWHHNLEAPMTLHDMTRTDSFFFFSLLNAFEKVSRV